MAIIRVPDAHRVKSYLFCLPRFSPGPSGDSSSLEESANVFMDCSRHQHLELNRSRKTEFLSGKRVV